MNETIAISPPAKVVEWVGDEIDGYLRLLDQTRLPNDVAYVDCRTPAAVWDAIKRLVVRGAPAIGVAAGYGMVIAGQVAIDSEDFMEAVENAAVYLESSRPTAVNLSWAARRVLARVQCEMCGPEAHGRFAKRSRRSKMQPAIVAAMLEEARAIHTEDEAMCLAIGRNGAELVKRCSGVLTHCNAGALATAGIGTATAPMYVAHAGGHAFSVYCDETRPLLQGSRLTAWELMQAGIDAVLITDNMAAHVMREGRVQMVIVGADRIAANGDTANKIGTYGVAIAAARHNIPFYVAAPYSTFDLSIASGAEIPIEERAATEITNGFGLRTAPLGVKTYSPAFDVTPADLIAGIITDKGLIQPVTVENIRHIIA